MEALDDRLVRGKLAVAAIHCKLNGGVSHQSDRRRISFIFGLVGGCVKHHDHCDPVSLYLKLKVPFVKPAVGRCRSTYTKNGSVL